MVRTGPDIDEYQRPEMDDGNATTGSVRSLLEGATPPTALTAAAPATNYADNGTNLYVLCKNI